MIEDGLHARFVIRHLVRDVQPQNIAGGQGRKPLIDKGIEQRGVLGAGDVDPLASGQTAGHRALICAQADDELRPRLRSADEGVQPPAQAIFEIGELAVVMEEAREAVEVEVQAAVHQAGRRADLRPAQVPFLPGAHQEVIDLVGQRKAGILLEQGLERTLGVPLVGGREFARPGQRPDEGGLSHPADTDDRDQWVHAWNYKAARRPFALLRVTYLAERRRLEELHVGDVPA